MPSSTFGVREVQIEGFRSVRSVRLSPGPVCALLGGPSVGKSNVLEAIWLLLQQGRPAPPDVGRGAVRLHATLAGEREVELELKRSGAPRTAGPALPALFFPASLRSRRLVATPIAAPAAVEVAARHFRVAAEPSSAAPAAALLAGFEELCRTGHGGLVVLVEEPELFLRPQAQRYLYRLLRRFAANGNQVLYSTHEPAFLNVGRLDELAFVGHTSQQGTIVDQPRALDADESFRAISEVDAESGELFLANAVLLVEGRTEKLSLPFVFAALGHDLDREGITVVDCGGKPNIPLFIRICHAVRIPCVALHDRDAAPGRQPSRAERALNLEIAALAGHRSTFELAPDFEGVAGLRGHRHKPAHAFERFAQIGRDQMPQTLRDTVERVIALGRG